MSQIQSIAQTVKYLSYNKAGFLLSEKEVIQIGKEKICDISSFLECGRVQVHMYKMFTCKDVIYNMGLPRWC